MLKLAAVILGWLVSLGCLFWAIGTVVGLALSPQGFTGLGGFVAWVTVPFYGVLGVTLNPLVFPRLARAIWLRFLISAVATTAATFAGWLVATFLLVPSVG